MERTRAGKQKKNSAKRRSERFAVTLLSLLFLSTAVFATVKYVFRAPEIDTDKPTPSDTASSDTDGDPTDPTPTGRARREYCYTILVSGLDDDNGGSDTNILVRFDVPNKRIDLVSLPRDTLLHNEYRSNKLNFAYAKGGTELLQSEIENLLGIPVDFYVTVNLKGFIALVDQIGGVDFDIPEDMDYDDPFQNLHIHFTKGLRHLDGQEAMEVVRFRHNNDNSGYGGRQDIGRINTQQAFLKAVAKQLLQISNVKNIPGLVDIFYTYVKTDLTTGNLVWLGNEALNIGMENIHFATLPGDGAGYYKGQSVYVLDADATLSLINESLNPYNEPLTMEDTDILVP